VPFTYGRSNHLFHNGIDAQRYDLDALSVARMRDSPSHFRHSIAIGQRNWSRRIF